MSLTTASLLPEPPARDEAEFRLQAAVCQYLRFAAPPELWWHSIPNGGLRHSRVAQKLAATGCRAGVPDLLCIFKGRSFYIELKTERGALSAVQKQVHRKILFAQADVFVLRSVEGVQNTLLEMGVPLKGRLT